MAEQDFSVHYVIYVNERKVGCWGKDEQSRVLHHYGYLDELLSKAASYIPPGDKRRVLQIAVDENGNELASVFHGDKICHKSRIRMDAGRRSVTEGGKGREGYAYIACMGTFMFLKPGRFSISVFTTLICTLVNFFGVENELTVDDDKFVIFLLLLFVFVL